MLGTSYERSGLEHWLGSASMEIYAGAPPAVQDGRHAYSQMQDEAPPRTSPPFLDSHPEGL